MTNEIEITFDIFGTGKSTATIIFDEKSEDENLKCLDQSLALIVSQIRTFAIILRASKGTIENPEQLKKLGFRVEKKAGAENFSITAVDNIKND